MIAAGNALEDVLGRDEDFASSEWLF